MVKFMKKNGETGGGARRKGVDNVTVQGYAHLLNEKECQDNSVSWQGKRYSAVIISDGHGGEKYFRSAAGAYLACKIGKERISSFMESIRRDGRVFRDFIFHRSKREEMISRLEKSIIQRWNEEIEADMAACPFDSEELCKLNESDKEAVCKTPAKAYGATFIAAVVTENYLFVLKLGDGNVCVFKDGKAELFYGANGELRDEELQFNLTTSLCNGDADKEFKHCYVDTHNNHGIGGVVLTTDGVINSYTSEQAYLDFIGNIFQGYREETLEAAHNELAEFLPRLSEKGSGDDLSVGIVF